MTKLYVAAGGGGDALAAAIVHRALGHTEPAIIATYAWDRLAIDPLPGPRGVDDFTSLDPLGRHNQVFTSTTRPRPPSGSTLPRLAEDLADTLVLLDPTRGAAGMHDQLAELVEIHRPEAVTVLDVGGDAVARGDEPGLRSPLADALSLASAAGLQASVTVLVAGPGLDGELTERQVVETVDSAPLIRLTARDIDPFRATLDWHPSEATALLAAAALGVRGRVEVRDAGLIVDLTDAGATVYRLAHAQALQLNPLADALADTTSLDMAEDITRQICGFSEIDYERSKQKRIESVRRPADHLDLDMAVHAFERQASTRGVDYVTFRRLAEAIGPICGHVSDLRRYLIARHPARYQWPLWTVNEGTDRSREAARLSN